MNILLCALPHHSMGEIAGNGFSTEICFLPGTLITSMRNSTRNNNYIESDSKKNSIQHLIFVTLQNLYSCLLYTIQNYIYKFAQF